MLHLIPPFATAGAGAALVRLVGLLPSLLPTLLLVLPAAAVTVLSIGDGETLRVVVHGRRLTIPLACIETMEMAQAPFGAQSRALLTGLAPVSTVVIATARYGRTVAQIIRSGQNVNLRMMRLGSTFAYRPLPQQLRCPRLPWR